jgi:hypothetical protein
LTIRQFSTWLGVLFFSPTFFSWQKVEEKNVGEKNKRGLPGVELPGRSASIHWRLRRKMAYVSHLSFTTEDQIAG